MRAPYKGKLDVKNGIKLIDGVKIRELKVTREERRTGEVGDMRACATCQMVEYHVML